MIYLLSTNRKDWAEFAYEQWMKCESANLVVLDNSKECIDFWKIKSINNECIHHWIPQCENVSQMFNWYLDNNPPDEDLFYMDDDIELSGETLSEMSSWLNVGWDCVKLCKVYVTNIKNNKSGIWLRKAKHIGACFLISKDLWKSARFREDTVEGVIFYFISLNDYNCRYLHKPLANYMIHNDNVILKESMFNFNMNKIQLQKEIPKMENQKQEAVQPTKLSIKEDFSEVVLGVTEILTKMAKEHKVAVAEIKLCHVLIAELQSKNGKLEETLKLKEATEIKETEKDG